MVYFYNILKDWKGALLVNNEASKWQKYPWIFLQFYCERMDSLS